MTHIGDKTHAYTIKRGKGAKMKNHILVNEIKRLKKEKNALVLAHNYQLPEVQEVADIVGDSLKLSQEATKAKEDIIVLCGVHFMAESAKILSPNKKVLLPVKDAGCPMADMIDATRLKLFKKEYPNVPVVCYINTSVEVKAESDICCTSSNALRIINSISSNKIIFVPDKNLGQYLAKQVRNKELILWDGFCIVHHRVKSSSISEIREQYPEALILVHPECQLNILEEADFVGSTSEILNYASSSRAETFVIGTEMGVMHSLQKNNPNKKFYLLSPSLICANMKKTSLQDIKNALLNEEYEIVVDERVRLRASKSLERMIEMSWN